MKDVVAHAHDPEQPILNKMSPILSMLSVALENQRLLWNGDSLPGRSGSAAALAVSKICRRRGYAVLRGVQKLVQGKGSLESSLGGQMKGELVGGQSGFQPAPAYLQNSPALNQAREYSMANQANDLGTLCNRRSATGAFPASSRRERSILNHMNQQQDQHDQHDQAKTATPVVADSGAHAIAAETEHQQQDK